MRRRLGTLDPINVNWRLDVLDPAFAAVLEQKAGLTFELVADSAGDVNLARLREPFQASGDVDAVAVNVVIIGDHIAGIDADAQPDPTIAVGGGIIPAQSLLDLEPAGNGICRAVEFGKKSVTHGADQAAAMLGDLGLDQILCVIINLSMCSRLVDTHQSAVADDIGKQDGLQSALQMGVFHCRSPNLVVIINSNKIFTGCHPKVLCR